MIYSPDDFNIIADAEADREHWLECRRPLLTSSDIFSWIGDTPDWWGTNRDDILTQKVSGRPTEFSPEEETSVHHGTYDEENIARKTGVALGADVQCVNWLAVNPKWANLGASIDGFISFPKEARDPDPRFFQDRSICEPLREKLRAAKRPPLLEIKKSLARKWQKAPPEYYAEAQNQAQLHILDLEDAIIVAETVRDVRHYDSAQKRAYFRRYWDLRPYWVRRDPKFAAVLDRVNDEFGEAMHRLRVHALVETVE